jgi:hypothetical protein
LRAQGAAYDGKGSCKCRSGWKRKGKRCVADPDAEPAGQTGQSGETGQSEDPGTCSAGGADGAGSCAVDYGGDDAGAAVAGVGGAAAAGGGGAANEDSSAGQHDAFCKKTFGPHARFDGDEVCAVPASSRQTCWNEGGSECTVGTRVGATVGRGGGGVLLSR